MEYYPKETLSVTYSTESIVTGEYCDSPTAQSFNLHGCIQFDGPLYKPFRMYLKDDLFDQTKLCHFCGEPTEAHVISYVQQQWKLTLNVRRIASMKLEGEEDGKIWTWTKCLICRLSNGVPRKTVMYSDADEGEEEEQSFGKFLVKAYYETSNNLAPCGHSLQRDCLQYYGFGDMLMFLQFSPVEMFPVCLPPSIVDFNSYVDDAAAVYDENEPTWAISYALNSKDYKDQINDEKPLLSESNESVSSLFGHLDCESLDSVEYEESDSSTSSGQNSSFHHHVTISFEDDGYHPPTTVMMGKVRNNFSITCYFAQQFHALRKIYHVGELDFVNSLSCCSAIGGKKKNTYFAKSVDERYIIKQISKTELESFEEFASKYFKFLIESIREETPSCMTKILGIYQVTKTNLNEEDDENKEKMSIELMVIKNIFFKRKISSIHSLKESIRYHDISKITDPNEVLLDMNVSKEVRSVSFFLPRKRILQRAVWNDTFFLNSVGVTDYFLLIGVDEKSKEMVFGIFDFFTKYAAAAALDVVGTKEEASTVFSKYYSDCNFGLGQESSVDPTIAVSPEKLKKGLRMLVNHILLCGSIDYYYLN